MASSDAELIEASWTDAGAFGQIFDRHLAAVYGFCARRVGASAGEELAGETFTRAFAARKLFDVNQRSARPWLFGIGRNLVRERLRTLGREEAANQRSVAGAESSALDPAVLVASREDTRQELAAIARALGELPADEVETLLLHVWDGLTYADCALVLGVPVGTIRSRLNRLRRRLREMVPKGPAGEEPPSPDVGRSSIVPLRLLGGVRERPI